MKKKETNGKERNKAERTRLKVIFKTISTSILNILERSCNILIFIGLCFSAFIQFKKQRLLSVSILALNELH